MRIFADVVGFEWDDANREKSLTKHGVLSTEAEEVFLDEKRVVREDIEHSGTEARHYCLGKTREGRVLFVSFTVRHTRICVISVRPINRKERKLYEEA